MSQHSGTSSPLSEHPASPALLTRSWSTWASWLLCLLWVAHQGSFTLCLVVQPSHSTHSNRGEVEGSHACVLGHLDQSGQVLIWPGRRGPQADTGLSKPHQASAKQHVLGFIHAPSQFENRSRSHVLPRVCLSCVALPDVSTSVRVAHLKPSYPEGNFGGNQLLGGSIGLSPLCRSRATRFARQNSDQLPPQFPMASLSNGKVHHLSGPLDLASTQNPVLWTSGPVVPAGVSHRDVRLP